MPTMRRFGMAARLPANLMLVVFAPFAAGYFLSFFYRNVNAVISRDLAREFDLAASDLGFLTSMYLLAFAAFQLPLGVLLDRYGPRRDRKSTRLNSSHANISYAVFCLKTKNTRHES